MEKKIVNKEYNKVKARVREAIRKSFAYSDMYKQFKQSCIVLPNESVQAKFPRAKTFYRCNRCNCVKPWASGSKANFNVDHITPIGKGVFNSLEDTQLFFSKVYNYPNLQLLCIDCHKYKTSLEKSQKLI